MQAASPNRLRLIAQSHQSVHNFGSVHQETNNCMNVSYIFTPSSLPALVEGRLEMQDEEPGAFRIVALPFQGVSEFPGGHVPTQTAAHTPEFLIQ